MNRKRNGKGTEYKSFYLENNGDYYSYLSINKLKLIKIFSGEYMNGERKERKEYNYDEKLVYEGEYLNGERKEGKLYNNDSELIYEGEIKNGKRHGKGEGYYRYYRNKYIGEYSESKKNGKGKEYYLEDDSKEGYLIFEGEYYNNYRFRGKEYFNNGKLKFEGEYLFQEKWNGKFYDFNGNVIFELKEGNAKVEEEINKIKIYVGENLNKKKYKGKN